MITWRRGYLDDYSSFFRGNRDREQVKADIESGQALMLLDARYASTIEWYLVGRVTACRFCTVSLLVPALLQGQRVAMHRCALMNETEMEEELRMRDAWLNRMKEMRLAKRGGV